MLSRICYMLLFIFFKQKTAYEMRISDWSSDVCSSDLRRSEGSGSEAPWKTVTAADKSWPPSSVRSPGRSRAVTPPVDAAEQEQPHHVDEMPVPGRRLEAEMMVRGEVALHGAHEADEQEDRADDHVETVEADRKSTRLNPSH